MYTTFWNEIFEVFREMKILFTLKMEAAKSSKMLVFYNTAWHHNPEDLDLIIWEMGLLLTSGDWLLLHIDLLLLFI
jgi:hypothetical protein